MIAHRGLSGIERENTNSAFVAAGNRSYFGIETDVHVTSDGKYIVFHDDKTGRVAEFDIEVEKTDFDTLRSLRIKDIDGTLNRSDLCVPSLSEYIGICKKYGKVAVLELKNAMKREDVYGIFEEVKAIGHLDKTIFISFFLDNLLFIREKNAAQPAQFLCSSADTERLDLLEEKNIDIDILYTGVDENLVSGCRKRNIKINVWTVDSAERAEALIDLGVDMITTNILE